VFTQPDGGGDVSGHADRRGGDGTVLRIEHPLCPASAQGENSTPANTHSPNGAKDQYPTTEDEDGFRVFCQRLFHEFLSLKPLLL
jgi:hypothetical protein